MGAGSNNGRDAETDANANTPFHGPYDPWRWSPWCKQATDFEGNGTVDVMQYFERNAYNQPSRIDLWQSGWQQEFDYVYDGRRLLELSMTTRAGLQARTTWTWNGDLVASSAYDNHVDASIDTMGGYEYDDRGRLTAHRNHVASPPHDDYLLYTYVGEDACADSREDLRLDDFRARFTIVNRDDCQISHEDVDYELNGSIDATIEYQYDSGGHPTDILFLEDGTGEGYEHVMTWDGDQILTDDYTDSVEPAGWYRDTFYYDCPDGIPPHDV